MGSRRLASNTMPAMGLVEPGRLHRLALVVEDSASAHAWFKSALGAGQLHAAWEVPETASGGEADLEGTDSGLFRVGGYPFILLSKGTPGGPVARFFRRYGSGVHSLAWEVQDMWIVQNLLITQGIGIGAVNIPGRHFFMHPRDTHGVLMEWTDDSFGPNERYSDEGGGLVDVLGLGWVTAVVTDAESTAAFLSDLAGATPVSDNPQGSEAEEVTVDVRIGDLTLRLVTPTSPTSRYRTVPAGPRLWSFTLRVADLAIALKALEGTGIGTVHRQDGLAATDPSTTFGLPIEWTDSPEADAPSPIEFDWATRGHSTARS